MFAEIKKLLPKEITRIAREFFPGFVPGSPIVSGGDKLPYWIIGRLNFDDEIRPPSCLVSRRDEKRTKEIRVGTQNVCGSMDNKIHVVCERMKDRRLDILCANETKRKGIFWRTSMTEEN
ncbi:hypothetical protein EVAR_20033_1 [Eumeta japonica]|uniref:Uncharacterized protein n=1 Tax=Eumeta variegata TaxID=151549 RepID=A0A4C1UI70_EUMVA|nr:hypothetical protein EVAR_20033_1 [Eumeta japonica]